MLQSRVTFPPAVILDHFPGDTAGSGAGALVQGFFPSSCNSLPCPCAHRTKAPIPCKKCSAVLFCSVECRQSSYFHTIECSILDLLFGSGMSINCFLALRLLTQSPLSYFMDMKEKLQEEENPKASLVTDTVMEKHFFLDHALGSTVYIYELPCVFRRQQTTRKCTTQMTSCGCTSWSATPSTARRRTSSTAAS